MVAVDRIRRGDVVLVALDPVRGRELRKSRPCLVVSPDELNAHWATVIVAPMTTGGRAYPFRLPCRFARKNGFVVLDQVRSIDRTRITRKLGRISPTVMARSLDVLREMFET